MVATAAKSLKISGPVREFPALNSGNPRRYVLYQTTYGEIKELFQTFTYSAAGNRGEQREQVATHVNKLRRAMEEGDYTPTSFSAALNKTHRDALKIHEGIVSLSIDSDNPLRNIDGGHRFAALSTLCEIEEYRSKITSIPVDLFIYLDGDAKTDFVNLQAGRTVDRAQQKSMSLSNFDDEEKFAFRIAQELNKDNRTGQKRSPLVKMIRFDTKTKSPIPIQTLLAKGSEIALSLSGAARICQKYEREMDWYCDLFGQVHHELETEAPAVLEPTKVLCPPPEGKNVGAKMLVGVVNMVAYRLCLLERRNMNQDDKALLVKAAKANLNHDRGGSVNHRAYIGQFTQSFLGDLIKGKDAPFAGYEGVPRPLVGLFSTSTFGLPKMEAAAMKELRRELNVEGEPEEETEGELVAAGDVVAPQGGKRGRGRPRKQ